MMPIARKDFLNRTLLNDFSRIHDRNLITNLRYDAEVMGNQYHCRFQLLLKLAHHCENLGLNGHV
ncbi:hypothetical protein SDC9_136537 [bioreactor metagenome]|uniref:Uncharacterized protein n=1 Tax=bioreactor metagenome TaxID=1076179 RepID=A0A645DK43_9ZZZZ